MCHASVARAMQRHDELERLREATAPRLQHAEKDLGVRPNEFEAGAPCRIDGARKRMLRLVVGPENDAGVPEVNERHDFSRAVAGSSHGGEALSAPSKRRFEPKRSLVRKVVRYLTAGGVDPG